MLELYQAEWCPHSHAVRTRLTELRADFVARQVEAEPEERDALRERAGTDEIPVLVSGAGEIVAGEESILAWLDDEYEDAPDAPLHREKAAEHAEAS